MTAGSNDGTTNCSVGASPAPLEERAARCDGDADGRYEHAGWHCPPRREPVQHEPRDDHGQGQPGKLHRRGDRSETDRKEDAGEHGTRDRTRDAGDGTPESGPETAQHDQCTADQKSAHGGAEVVGHSSRSNQECGPRCGPRERDGHSEPPCQHDAAQSAHDADGEQARRSLRLARPYRTKTGDNEHERACEARDRRNDTSRDGLDQPNGVGVVTPTFRHEQACAERSSVRRCCSRIRG